MQGQKNPEYLLLVQIFGIYGRCPQPCTAAFILAHHGKPGLYFPSIPFLYFSGVIPVCSRKIEMKWPVEL